VIRLAVDIGGTFTDVVLDVDGTRYTAKVLTTPSEPENGFLEGAQAALAKAGVKAADVGAIVHGTTLATNAIIERKGARVGLLTTEGFRDSLEIAYEHRFEQSDLYMVRPEPLVPREHRWGVAGRIVADGSELVALDEAALETVAQDMKKAPLPSASCIATPTTATSGVRPRRLRASCRAYPCRCPAKSVPRSANTIASRPLLPTLTCARRCKAICSASNSSWPSAASGAGCS
jgi:N-methylhydantoinase A